MHLPVHYLRAPRRCATMDLDSDGVLGVKEYMGGFIGFEHALRSLADGSGTRRSTRPAHLGAGAARGEVGGRGQALLGFGSTSRRCGAKSRCGAQRSEGSTATARDERAVSQGGAGLRRIKNGFSPFAIVFCSKFPLL